MHCLKHFLSPSRKVRDKQQYSVRGAPEGMGEKDLGECRAKGDCFQLWGLEKRSQRRWFCSGSGVEGEHEGHRYGVKRMYWREHLFLVEHV